MTRGASGAAISFKYGPVVTTADDSAPVILMAPPRNATEAHAHLEQPVGGARTASAEQGRLGEELGLAVGGRGPVLHSFNETQHLR